MVLGGKSCSGYGAENGVQKVVRSVEGCRVVIVHGVGGRKSLKYGNYRCVRILRYLRIFSVFGGSRHLSGEPRGKNVFRPPKNSYLLLNIYIYIYT